MTLTRSQVIDIVAAVAFAVVGVLGTVGVDQNTSVDVPVDGRAFAFVVPAAVTLAVRRRWPLVTLAIAALLTVSYLVIGYPYGPILFSFFVAVYTVARYTRLSRSVPASLAALALLLLHLLTHPAALPGGAGLAPASAWVAVPYAIGVVVRINRESITRQRADAVREQVCDERLRIAQEVHDVVGHGLAAIKMQADVALHLLPRKPEQAEPALRAISRTSASALEELRATLAMVRRADSAGSGSPGPGLHGLEDLLHRMSQTGLRVTIDTTGLPQALPAPIDLAAYRVVQEGLTNVLKHGRTKEASVGVDYVDDTVVITVSNAAHNAVARLGGLGIPGMRDRVTSLGGDFTAGPTQGGRFEVRASIPTGRCV